MVMKGERLNLDAHLEVVSQWMSGRNGLSVWYDGGGIRQTRLSRRNDVYSLIWKLTWLCIYKGLTFLDNSFLPGPLSAPD